MKSFIPKMQQTLVLKWWTTKVQNQEKALGKYLITNIIQLNIIERITILSAGLSKYVGHSLLSITAKSITVLNDIFAHIFKLEHTVQHEKVMIL